MKSSEIIAGEKATTAIRIKDIAILFKTRLSIFVVISSVLMYFLGTSEIDWVKLTVLCFGGYLLTGASNGFNQIWERDLDILMDRTKDRPIPAGRMSVKTAFVLSLVAALLGIVSMWVFINSTIGILSVLAIFSYVFLYTPLKQHSVIAVVVGAFPGAIPPLLGYVAATGTFGLEAGILFMVQFFWQFPHFWSIAWVAHDDYQKANYNLLPFLSGKSKASAWAIFVSCVLLVPAGALPWFFPIEQALVGDIAMIVSIIMGLWVLWKGWKLVKHQDMKSARGLMFSTFLYLPVVQIIYLIDKI